MLSVSRNLSKDEVELAINYYNKKYSLALKIVDNNQNDLSALNQEIKELKEGSSLTAVASVSSHTFAIRIDKKNNQNILIIDGSYALLNTIDYKSSTDSVFETFCYLSREELKTFIKKIKYIDKIYANQERYQLDAGSCSTFGLVNAKHLALNAEYFIKEHKLSDNPLGQDVFFYPPTKKHKKYTQLDKNVPADDDLYPENFAVHARTKKIRTNIYIHKSPLNNGSDQSLLSRNHSASTKKNEYGEPSVPQTIRTEMLCAPHSLEEKKPYCIKAAGTQDAKEILLQILYDTDYWTIQSASSFTAPDGIRAMQLCRKNKDADNQTFLSQLKGTATKFLANPPRFFPTRRSQQTTHFYQALNDAQCNSWEEIIGSQTFKEFKKHYYDFKKEQKLKNDIMKHMYKFSGWRR